MKILVFGSLALSLANFRADLMSDMLSRGHEVLAMAPGADEVASSLPKDVATIHAPLSRTGLNPVADAASLVRLTGIMRRTRPDAILSYTVKPVVYGSMAARLAGVDDIFSMITGLGYAFGEKSGLVGRVARGLYKKALSYNRAVFFQNPDDQRLFHDLGLVPGAMDTVVTNGSGVNLERFAPAELPPGPPVFLMVARLLKAKGVAEFIQAAKLVKARHPEARFVLVGPQDHGPDRMDPAMIRHWTDQGVIEYPGPSRDVRPHLASATVFVLPSYREGTPRSALEAMAMARPLVVADVPGSNRTVNHGENGLLVPARSVEPLASAMRRFILEPGLAQKMGLAGRRLAEERFDVRKVNRTILQTMGL